MKTMTVHAEVSADGLLKLEVPCDLAPGRVQVILTVSPYHSSPADGRIERGRLSGLGKEVWQDIEPRSYISDLREDRDLGT